MDDLGTQGRLPSHPALLDWLAVEFIKQRLEHQAMLKLMVMSNAYRQSSATTKEMRQRDPGNVWLARQNRFRLDAEFVRDNALAVSGLLSAQDRRAERQAVSAGRVLVVSQFPQARMAERQGRGPISPWAVHLLVPKFLHPSLFAFDAPTREECTNERSRSSTPLQAIRAAQRPNLCGSVACTWPNAF